MWTPMNKSNDNAKKRILCIADHPNWIFNRHIEALKRYLQDEFEILTAYRYEPYAEDAYDLIYPLEYMLVDLDQIQNPHKYVTGIRSWISWAEKDFIPFTHYLTDHYQRVHVVSRELYNVFSPYIPSIRYITHGIDMDLFTSGIGPSLEAGKLRLGWAGRRDTFIKGYQDFIQPLTEIPGVELKICGFVDCNLTLAEMPDFYNSIDAYVCATSFEGSNNSILEAAAMERAIITTPVGTVPELFVDHESALIVERRPGAFRGAVEELRDNPELRIQLGKRARQALIAKKWDWKYKAEDYRQFFRDALQNTDLVIDSRQTIPTEIRDEKRYYETIQSQNQLLREMRIGDWIMIYDLNQQIKSLDQKFKEERENLLRVIKHLESEIYAIHNSETFKLASAFKANWFGKWMIRLYKSLHPLR
jgi:glycosyltransferase involved in cell wall biosynthesis